jgi:Per os infectivity
MKCLVSDTLSCAHCREGRAACVSGDKLKLVSKRNVFLSVLEFPSDHAYGLCIPLGTKKSPMVCNKFNAELILSRNNTLPVEYDFICICKYPHLLSQKSYYEDCDQVKACKPHGQLITDITLSDVFQNGRCKCGGLFVGDHNKRRGPFCRPRLVSEAALSSPKTNCPNGFMNLAEDGGANRCVRNMCEWDVFTGKANNNPYSRINKSYLCHCDPSFGNIPVYSSNSSHPNGCFNILNSPKGGIKFRETCMYMHNEETLTPKCTLEFIDIGLSLLNSITLEAVTLHYKELNQPLPAVVTLTFSVKWPFTATNFHLSKTRNSSANKEYFYFVNNSTNILRTSTAHVTSNIDWNEIINSYSHTSKCLSITKRHSNFNSVTVANQKYGIPFCNELLLLRVSNNLRVYSYNLSRRFLSSVSGKMFNWKSTFYLPYCMQNDELYINPILLNDVTLNSFSPNTSIFSNKGLELPEYTKYNQVAQFVNVSPQIGREDTIEFEWENSRKRTCRSWEKCGYLCRQASKPIEITHIS